jgi:hypothetical protein
MTWQWQFLFTVKEKSLSYSTLLNNATYFVQYNNIYVQMHIGLKNKQNALKYVGICGISQVLQLWNNWHFI